MKFWNFKFNNKWVEVTTSRKTNKPELLKKLNKLGYNLKNSDLWTSINAPNECPDTFIETLHDF